jgi:hypothetical protein
MGVVTSSRRQLREGTQGTMPTRRETDLTALERPRYRGAEVRKGPERITASATVRHGRWSVAARLTAAGDNTSADLSSIPLALASCMPSVAVNDPDHPPSLNRCRRPARPAVRPRPRRRTQSPRSAVSATSLLPSRRPGRRRARSFRGYRMTAGAVRPRARPHSTRSLPLTAVVNGREAGRSVPDPTSHDCCRRT